MFGRFVTGFKTALQVQSEPPTPSPGSPIPGGQRTRDARYQPAGPGAPAAPRYASSGSLEQRGQSPTPDLLLDGLSEAERAHILSVMARADSNVDISATAAPGPSVKPSMAPDREKPESAPPPAPIRARSDSIQRPVQASRSGSQTNLLPLSTSTSIADIPLDGLTEEERAHILRVMARAESGGEISSGVDHMTVSKTDSLPAAPSPAPSTYEEEAVDPMLASQLENSGLEEWELRQIMSVMNKARRESDAVDSLPPPDTDRAGMPAPETAPFQRMQQQQPVPQYHQEQLKQKQQLEEEEEESTAKLKHGGEIERGIPNEALRRASSGSEATEGKDEEVSDNEDGVHSSEETEGADDESPIEDGSGYSSPVPPVEQEPVSARPEPYQPRLDSIEKASHDYIEDKVTQPPARDPLLDDPALLAMLPEGMENLSIEEQEQILSVLRRAAMESGGAMGAPPPAPAAPVIDSEWHQQASYPFANNNNNINNEARSAPTATEPTSYSRDRDRDRFEDDQSQNVYDTSTMAGRRRVPDLTFEITEEQSFDHELADQPELEYQKGTRLGGVSPVSITIVPPSPCPTEDSESEEEDYWTRAAQRMQEEQEQEEQAESEYDQPQETVTEADMTAEPTDEYETTWTREEDYAQQRYAQPVTEEAETEEAQEEAQWQENADEAGFRDEYGESEDMADSMTAPSQPIIEEPEEEYQEEEQRQQTLSKGLNEEELIEETSPMSDQQRSSIEYAAGEEGAGNEADNEDERYDRFDIDGAESSSYDDANAAASSYYGTDYYMAEYQRSESGSSSGYGSRGVLGLSSYASGEGLSQQSGFIPETGPTIGALTAVDSGLSRASSLQEQFSGDSGHVTEIADTRTLIEEPKFDDIMTKSAPADSSADKYAMHFETYQEEQQEQSSKEPPAEYYEEEEEEDWWSGDPTVREEGKSPACDLEAVP